MPQVQGFGVGGGKGLLHQDVFARFQELPGMLMMQSGRGGNVHRVNGGVLGKVLEGQVLFRDAEFGTELP